MSLQEAKKQAFNLSVSERLTLVSLIIKSLQSELNSKVNPIDEQSSAYISDNFLRDRLGTERTALIHQMRGLLKTDKAAPTDAEVQSMLEERLVEKYLQ